MAKLFFASRSDREGSRMVETQQRGVQETWKASVPSSSNATFLSCPERENCQRQSLLPFGSTDVTLQAAMRASPDFLPMIPIASPLIGFDSRDEGGVVFDNSMPLPS